MPQGMRPPPPPGYGGMGAGGYSQHMPPQHMMHGGGMGRGVPPNMGGHNMGMPPMGMQQVGRP